LKVTFAFAMRHYAGDRHKIEQQPRLGCASSRVCFKTSKRSGPLPRGRRRNVRKSGALITSRRSKESLMEESMMTEAQRDELKTLCQKANVPDKTGELLTQEGAQHFIDQLKKQLAERK
jgi:hypothetical protein